MTHTVRWGILATGGIARLFTQDLLSTGRKVVAVGSRSGQSAERFAAHFGIPKAHPSYRDLLADPAVDVVYVATPHSLHAENAMAALRAGKHVLVEKPFTLNAAEAQKVVELAQRTGLVVLEAMWTRFLPHMVRIREIVASGILGQVRAITADHQQKLPADPTHRLNDLRLGGGALLDLGIYPISFAWNILGKPQSIEATARFRPTGADAQVTVIMRHAAGAISTSVAASDAVGPNAATVVGSEGRIAIDRVWYEPTTFRVRNARGDVLEKFKSSVDGRGMQYQAAEVERLIESGKLAGEILAPEESVAIMRTLDAIRARIGLRYPGE